MTETLREEALEFLAAVPSSDSGDPVANPLRRPNELRILKQLEEHGLVEVVRKRPKTVRVAGTGYARTLHGILRSRPHFLSILTGHHVPVISALVSTSKGETVESISALLGLHSNTIRKLLNDLRDRGLLQAASSGFRLAPHVPELAELGRLFNEHRLAKTLQKFPGTFPVARRGVRIIVESMHPIAGLPATGIYKLQQEGAPVLESRFQYVLTPGGGSTTSSEAYQDAQALATSPRTLDAARKFLRDRGVAVA